ncbi:unnamed protein product [Spirodela intermedia]|uniref:Tf2-1-like SH3-like domain-containing protein n=2 Tax=Spirodela intermedia TaxID=51605 RepID=A0A7I8KJ62_SPIIN|nr:unnamed protein product [Spirodela intermedia]CAA6661114.1 unnamed protein product [Spirodela intermedia]CAA7397482.1 unnamed protein product [Spirodela intermedia]
MTTVVHCLGVWMHYLLGQHFTIYTDNVATSCRLAYRLRLPPRLPIHPIFHISLLKAYNADVDDP